MSSLIEKEITQGAVLIGTPKSYQYDAALVEAAKATVQQGMTDIASKTAEKETELDSYTETKKTEVSTLGQGYVDSASQKVDEANTILSAIRNEYGYPFTAATAADMTDTSKIYVYVGSETGYVNGNWYYYNGTAWVSGGVYNATAFETDKTLTVSNAAADAKVVGTALYRSKSRDSNTPAGLTFWNSATDGYSNTNPFTPANIPVNSYTYVQGSRISATDLSLQSNAYYWVFCFASTYNSAMRRYRIVRVPTTSFPVPITYIGHTTNSGNAVRWATEEIDETLSVSGASADASVVGTALYRSKNRDSNTPAGITFWWSSADGYDSTNPFSPTDMPGNTYTVVTGNVTSGFSPDGTKLLDSGIYYIIKLQSTYNSSLGIIFVYSLSGDRTFIGTANRGVYKFYGMPSPSIKIAYFGDSITRGINSDNYPGVNQYSEVNIPVLLNNETGLAVDNYGIGSIGWLENGGETKGTAIEYLQRMGNADWYINGGSYANNKFVGNTKNWTDYNTVVLAFGANDRAVDGTGTVLGSLDDIDNTMTYEQVMAMTPTTIVEAVYQCYRYIREQAPTINIIISDPLIQRGGSAPEWSYPTRYSASRWSWYELCEMYEAFARKYGCGHISNYDAPINRVDISTSLKDGVHPTTACYYQLARHFAGKLSALV